MNLGPALAALERDGFAHLPGAIDPGTLLKLRRAFDRLLVSARAVATTGVQPDDARFVVDSDPFRLHRVIWAGGVDDDLAAMGEHPVFLQIASAVLGSEKVVQLIQQAHFKLPGDGVQFNWHQDASNRRYGSDLWTDVDGRGSFVQVVLAIDPMTAENGPLRMLPGSQSLGFIADPTTGALGELPDIEPVTLELAPGDIAFFGPFVIHGSAPNTSASARRLFLQGYASPGANRRVYPGCGQGIVRQVHA